MNDGVDIVDPMSPDQEETEKIQRHLTEETHGNREDVTRSQTLVEREEETLIQRVTHSTLTFRL
jgi:hypothetical protein